MKRVLAYSFLVLLLVMATAAQVKAQVPPPVGPVDPATGFPTFMTDVNGVQVGLCNDGTGLNPAGTPPCTSFTVDPVTGLLVEAMYYSASVVLNLPDGTRIVARFVVEAAGAAAGAPASVINGSRLDIRLPDVVTVDTPFTYTDPFNPVQRTAIVPAGTDRVRDLNEVISVAPFADAMTGIVNTFIGNGTAGCIGPGFLGDGLTPAPLVAAGPGAGGALFTITGAPIGTVTSTDAGGFVVEGKLFAPAAAANGGFAIERATISGGLARATGTVVASTNVGTAMQITSVAGKALATPINMVGDPATGRFFASGVTLGNITGIPNVALGISVTTATTPIVVAPIMEDTVTIRSATFTKRTNTLSITASSSVPGSAAAPGPVLTARGTDKNGIAVVGSLPATPLPARGALRVTGLTVPPSFVTVTSALGGTMTVPVTMR